MTLAQVRALVAVAEQRSFSKAALELDMSQAAVSSSVKELERELGLALLERGRFGARPTVAGERVIEQGRAMLHTERVMRQIADATKGELRGEVRVAVFHSVASYVIPAVLLELAEPYPGLAVELLETEHQRADDPERHSSYYLFDALRNGRADVAFAQLPLPVPGEPLDDLLIWDLFEDDFVAIAAPSLLTGIGARSFDMRLLGRAPLLVNPDGACGWMVRDHLREYLGSAPATRSIRDDVAIVQMAQRGLGIGVLPRLAVDAVAVGAALYPLVPRLTRTVVVAVHAQGLKVPAVRAFLWALGRRYPEASLPGVPLEWTAREEAGSGARAAAQV